MPLVGLTRCKMCYSLATVVLQRLLIYDIEHHRETVGALRHILRVWGRATSLSLRMIIASRRGLKDQRVEIACKLKEGGGKFPYRILSNLILSGPRHPVRVLGLSQ